VTLVSLVKREGFHGALVGYASVCLSRARRGMSGTRLFGLKEGGLLEAYRCAQSKACVFTCVCVRAFARECACVRLRVREEGREGREARGGGGNRTLLAA
jgi:hypothetical protein